MEVTLVHFYTVLVNACINFEYPSVNYKPLKRFGRQHKSLHVANNIFLYEGCWYVGASS